MKSSTVVILILTAIVCGSAQSQRPTNPRMAQPSSLLTATLPGEDLTITIHGSPEFVTALEKSRLDDYTAVIANGATMLQPNDATRAAHLKKIIAVSIGALFQKYPPASVANAASGQQTVSDALQSAVRATLQ